MIVKIITLFSLFFLSVSSFATSDCVILLHGLARTKHSMTDLEGTLTSSGYKVVNIGYPSTTQAIEILAMSAISEGLERCGGSSTVSFVTHSMGGILVRQYLSEKNIVGLHRVVMLGPPNRGSEVVDELEEFPGFRLINGEAGTQLGTNSDSLPNQLGPVDFDLGIIAGTRSINPILSSLLPDPDDGKVSVYSTKVEGMNDHVEMPVTHALMMKNADVMKQILYYLKHGRFHKTDAL